MASTDAKPVPQKNVAYRVTFPILDADGDLVTGATGLDSEVSKDGGTFADCTNEATEIATNSGMYYLDLTSTEMNADTVAIIVKTTSSGAKTTPIVLYPEEAGDIRVNVTAFGGTAGTFASGRPEVNTTHIAGSAVSTSSAQIGVNVVNAGGTAWGSGAITAASIASSAITSAKFGAGAITASVIATNAIDADALAADADAVIAGAVWNAAVASYGTANTYGALVETNLDATVSSRLATSGYTAPATAAAIADAVWDESTTGHTTAGTFGEQVKTDIDAILVDTAEIGAAGAGLTALATQASVNTIDDFLDTEIAAIKAKTDNLPAAPAATGDIPTTAAIADAVWDEATLGHTTAGTFGEQLKTDVDAILVDTGTTLDGLITTVDTVVDAIKAKTDSLAFTVAGQVDANVQSINDVTITGDGQTGSEFGV